MAAITIGKAHSSRAGVRTGGRPAAGRARLARFALFPCVALAAVLMAIVNVAAAAGATAAPRSGEWDFQVLLDGKPIGEHRFRLDAEGDNESRLASDARFDVKVLGFTVYRYRHDAVEHWRGNCLASIRSTTDDDGKPSHVQLAAAGAGGTLPVAAPNRAALEGCVMSFAYWHPAMRTQTQLLNAQTGRIEAVRVERLGDAPVDVRGEPVAAHGYRISGAGRPVDVWYAAAGGEWVGLDAVVGAGRKLSYRLR